METTLNLGNSLNNLSKACDALLVSRATLYRAMAPKENRVKKPRPVSPRALPEATRNEVLPHLHSPTFVDRSPTEVFHTLLDRGIYLASLRSIYRILAANNEVRERRNQLRHPKHKKPELMATAPRQVWT